MAVCFISGRTKDSVHLVHNNYRFSKDRTRNGTIYWRCMLSRRTNLNPVTCKARISTDKNGNVLTFGQEHNHPPDETEIKVRKCISDIKRVAELGANDLINNYVSKLPDEVKVKLPSRKALQKCAQRSRKRSNCVYVPSFLPGHNLGYSRLPGELSSMMRRGEGAVPHNFGYKRGEEVAMPHNFGYKRLPAELCKPKLILSLPPTLSNNFPIIQNLSTFNENPQSNISVAGLSTCGLGDNPRNPCFTVNPNLKPRIELPPVLHAAAGHATDITQNSPTSSNMIQLLSLLMKSNETPDTDHDEETSPCPGNEEKVEGEEEDQVQGTGLLHSDNKENVLSVTDKLLQSIASDNRLGKEALELITTILKG